MKHCLSSLFFLLLYAAALQAQTCSCSQQFDWLRQKLETNYAGYKDKVRSENKAQFEAYTADYQQKTNQSRSDTNCLRLMTEWATWFHDGHVQLYREGAAEAPEVIRQRFANWDKITLSDASAKGYLTEPGHDPVEGIYWDPDNNYRVAIVRNGTPDRDYAAAVLKADSVYWMPGQVKFDLKTAGQNHYTVRYYMRDHSQRNLTADFRNNTLEINEIGIWYKLFPETAKIPVKTPLFSLLSLDSTTLLIRVPTMNVLYRNQLDSLIQANRALLERTPNLVIDCRNNGGGSDITFFPLRRYVYSGKVSDYRAQLLATPDNREFYLQMKNNPNFPKGHRLYYGQVAERMEHHYGSFIGRRGKSSHKVKDLSANPKKVAILINTKCASSCEQFVWYANQSNRVVLIGEHTAGVSDYGNLNRIKFPCGNFMLGYPTSRSCGVDKGEGIDGKGIVPDVALTNENKDWVEFARQYLHGLK